MLVFVVVQRIRYGRALGSLLLLEACMEPSGAIKTSPQDKAFRSIPAQRLLGPMCEVHSIFSNRDLPRRKLS